MAWVGAGAKDIAAICDMMVVWLAKSCLIAAAISGGMTMVVVAVVLPVDVTAAAACVTVVTVSSSVSLAPTRML